MQRTRSVTKGWMSGFVRTWHKATPVFSAWLEI
jgi:hypothetical protein